MYAGTLPKNTCTARSQEMFNEALQAPLGLSLDNLSTFIRREVVSIDENKNGSYTWSSGSQRLLHD